MICPRCRALLPEPLPSCPGCGYSLPRGRASDAMPPAVPTALPLVVVRESSAPLTPAECARSLFEAGGVGADGALLLIALAERRLELLVGLGWEHRLPLAEVHAELRERVVPLLAQGALEPAVALAERIIAEALHA